MKSHAIMTAATALTLLTGGAQAQVTDVQFAKIGVGTTADAVVALMQRPPDTEEVTYFGLPKTRWRWSAAGGRSFVVIMIGNRVVITKTCAAMPDC